MMLVTSTRSPPSCAAMLPQKFSVATTVNAPRDGVTGPERPHPQTSAAAARPASSVGGVKSGLGKPASCLLSGGATRRAGNNTKRMRLSLIDQAPAAPAFPGLRTPASAPRAGAYNRTDVRSVRNCRGSGCLRGSVLAPGSAPELAHPPAHAPGDGDAADRRERTRVGGLERVHKAAGEGRGASPHRASAVATRP